MAADQQNQEAQLEQNKYTGKSCDFVEIESKKQTLKPADLLH